MKNFIRNYSIASLFIIVLASAAILMSYRLMVIRGITKLAETNSIVTARTALHPIRSHLADYLGAANSSGRNPKSVLLPTELENLFAEMMRDSHVARVKIYNKRGVVIYSTVAAKIGYQQADNTGFIEAMAGRVAVKLVYRDTFNTFDKATEEDNLVQTYMPVRRRSAGPVLGVFELYTDVNQLVLETERFEIRIVVVTGLILAFMYVALLLLVFRSHKLIENQQRTIRDKSELLEHLSRDSMAREETDRKRLATVLHEGLAQTLGAVKLLLEQGRGGSVYAANDTLQSVIPVLQSAISQTRSIATDLRPPGLDDLGLGPTLGGLFNKFERENPTIRVARHITDKESAIPVQLKITVYRILESVLKFIGGHPNATQVSVHLETTGDVLTLVISDDVSAITTAMRNDEGENAPDALFSMVRERVVISGGKLSVLDRDTGVGVLHASWLL